MTLRVYRTLSSAIVPLSPALIKQRLKQGKEDPARIGERRGMSRDIRPLGPLVWIHGASVGDMFTSLIHTAELHGQNPFDYLTEVLRHARAAAERPGDWLPWTYKATLARLGQ